MSWGYTPDGKLTSRSDEGSPVGRHVVVVDNTDSQSTDRTTGAGSEWDSTTDTPPTHRGVDYLLDDPGTGSSVFTWELVIPKGGTYEVFARHGSEATATNAPLHGAPRGRVDWEVCPVPGLMEDLIPRKDESHGGTEEVPR